MTATKGMLSVTQVNEYLKMLMDGDRVLSNVFVRGEISNFKLYSSGHAYFTLKDETGQLKAVMFRSYASKLPFRPSDGMRVIAHGRISVYETNGQYQLYADELQPDGAGSLALRFEQIKRQLQSEGLFEESRKKPLPPMPMRIGVITSPSGAAVHDIMNVLGRRFPCAQMILFPSQVQGAEAPAQLMMGLEFFSVSGIADVVIIGRGGGSAEDLWAFNDEGLARAIAACPIPVISAVGHESDFTICDFVADKRAPTPSAAAELAVPETKALLSSLGALGGRMSACLEKKIREERRVLARISDSGVFAHPERLLDAYRMKLTDREENLSRAMAQLLLQKKNALIRGAGALRSLDPLAVLARGYAAISRGGDTVCRADDVEIKDSLEIRFTDGVVHATVTGKDVIYGEKNDV